MINPSSGSSPDLDDGHLNKVSEPRYWGNPVSHASCVKILHAEAFLNWGGEVAGYVVSIKAMLALPA